MNKKIALITLTIFLIILSLFIFKGEKKTEKKEVDKNVNYPFYKEELKNAYQEYQNKTNLPYKKVIIDVNIGLNKPFYTDTKRINNPNSPYVLVNKYHYLDKDFVPNDLVETKDYAKTSLLMQKIAYENFKEMANDAKKENLNIRIVSAYRSYSYQENLYNNYLKADSQEIVDTYSARAGYSEHQTGLAVDIDNIIKNYNQFHLTKEFDWMQRNAYKYGFILRYPLGKENITGYKYEPWHYRYIGKTIAKYIHDNDLTYDEYYAEFLDK